MATVIPEEFKCKQSGELMEWPTTTPCGHNFELGVIIALREEVGVGPNYCCPECQVNLGTDVSRINYDLRTKIQEFKKKSAKMLVETASSARETIQDGVVITRAALETNPGQVVFSTAAQLVAANVGNSGFSSASASVRQDLDRALDDVSRSLARLGSRFN